MIGGGGTPNGRRWPTFGIAIAAVCVFYLALIPRGGVPSRPGWYVVALMCVGATAFVLATPEDHQPSRLEVVFAGFYAGIAGGFLAGLIQLLTRLMGF